MREPRPEPIRTTSREGGSWERFWGGRRKKEEERSWKEGTVSVSTQFRLSFDSVSTHSAPPSSHLLAQPNPMRRLPLSIPLRLLLLHQPVQMVQVNIPLLRRQKRTPGCKQLVDQVEGGEGGGQGGEEEAVLFGEGEGHCAAGALGEEIREWSVRELLKAGNGSAEQNHTTVPR